jgi:hypothetical protein
MLVVARIVLALGFVVLAATSLPAQRRSDVITAEEIERARPTVSTAYDVVQSLRPRWLRAREAILTGKPDDPVEAVPLHVYLNDVEAGGPDYLKTILAEHLQELRWLSANQASSRFGPTRGPAIVVTLRR